MAKVSICIPCYNNPDELRRLIDSILIQDYTDYEVVISDDSTDDEIEKLIRQYKGTLKNLNYQHNEKPYGHIFNWNVSIKMAQGEYIKIMFSDDWFTFDYSLRRWVELLDVNPDAMLAFSGSRQVMLDIDKADSLGHVAVNNKTASYDRHADNKFIENLKKDYRYLFMGNQIGAPSAVIYRRGKVVALFDEKSNWASDMFLFFELLKGCSEFAYTKEPLISIGVHEHQYTEMFSDKDIRVYNDYRYMYTKYELDKNDECKEYFLSNFIVKYNMGLKEANKMGISTGKYFKAYIKEKGLSVKCFVKNKFRIGN